MCARISETTWLNFIEMTEIENEGEEYQKELKTEFGNQKYECHASWQNFVL